MAAVESEAEDKLSSVDLDTILSRAARRPLTFAKTRSLNRAPEFEKRLTGEETADEGETVQFQTKVNGFPEPTLRWFKEGEEIIEHPRFHVDYNGDGVYTLTLENANKGDAASYRCKAENEEGSTSCLFYLHVKGKPKSPKRSKGPTKRSVSYPPMFPTIVEKVEEEEKEGKETARSPPSPLTTLYNGLTLQTRNTWPKFLGDWAYVESAHRNGESVGSDPDSETVDGRWLENTDPDDEEVFSDDPGGTPGTSEDASPVGASLDGNEPCPLAGKSSEASNRQPSSTSSASFYLGDDNASSLSYGNNLIHNGSTHSAVDTTEGVSGQSELNNNQLIIKTKREMTLPLPEHKPSRQIAEEIVKREKKLKKTDQDSTSSGQKKKKSSEEEKNAKNRSNGVHEEKKKSDTKEKPLKKVDKKTKSSTKDVKIVDNKDKTKVSVRSCDNMDNGDGMAKQQTQKHMSAKDMRDSTHVSAKDMPDSTHVAEKDMRDTTHVSQSDKSAPILGSARPLVFGNVPTSTTPVHSVNSADPENTCIDTVSASNMDSKPREIDASQLTSDKNNPIFGPPKIVHVPFGRFFEECVFVVCFFTFLALCIGIPIETFVLVVLGMHFVYSIATILGLC